MKLYVAPLIYCFLIPTVFADDENGGLKKIRHRHHHTLWMRGTEAQKMRES